MTLSSRSSTLLRTEQRLTVDRLSPVRRGYVVFWKGTQIGRVNTLIYVIWTPSGLPNFISKELLADFPFDV